MQHMDVNRRSEVTLWAKFKSQTAVFSDPDHPFRLHFRTLYELIKTKRLSEQSTISKQLAALSSKVHYLKVTAPVKEIGWVNVAVSGWLTCPNK